MAFYTELKVRDPVIEAVRKPVKIMISSSEAEA